MVAAASESSDLMVATAQESSTLTKRWSPLSVHHPEHERLWTAPTRFDHAFAGRGSGKSEIVGKRRTVRRVFEDFERIVAGWDPPDTLRYAIVAPTWSQTKRIYWRDLKALFPAWAIDGRPSESELTIRTRWGAELFLASGDKPERLEGIALRGVVLDEFADHKPKIFEETILPCLTRLGIEGWCSFIGKPRGRNHAFELQKVAKQAIRESEEAGEEPEWGVYWWPSRDILTPAEIDRARRFTDPVTFAQEYEASWEDFAGRAYYDFHEGTHCFRLERSQSLPLELCFDFNVSPGVCVVTQEQRASEYPAGHFETPDLTTRGWRVDRQFTAVIDEVYIRKHSRTDLICQEIIERFGDHRGEVICYGDATGGAEGSAKTTGSDWAIIERTLGAHFGNRLDIRLRSENPSERARVNALNSRIRMTEGSVHLVLDPEAAPHTKEDFEGTVILEGTSGTLDKKTDKWRSHLTDAVGYKIELEYPIGGEIGLERMSY